MNSFCFCLNSKICVTFEKLHDIYRDSLGQSQVWFVNTFLLFLLFIEKKMVMHLFFSFIFPRFNEFTFSRIKNFIYHDPSKHVIQILRRLNFHKRECRETHSRKITIRKTVRCMHALSMQVELVG